jgi:hypothetical protein
MSKHVPSHIRVQYLVDYLCEEFSRFEEVRVRVHSEDHEEGIQVRTASREYFFPMEWAYREDFTQVGKLVAEIKAGLGHD